MLIDTHCHLNMMVKKKFDIHLSPEEIADVAPLINQAKEAGVGTIINVGTSLPESENCIALAQTYSTVFATVGIHPNDCTKEWKDDFNTLSDYVKNKYKNKIVGIGECGIDMHYPGYDLQRQKDAFRAQIELALAHDLALVVHSRDAYDETLRILEEYKHDIKRGTIHCFSYDLAFAQHAIDFGFVLGIDAPITYRKNETLRNVVKTLDLRHIVLETDAPFLPPQQFRGKQNHPKHIRTIAEYIAQLKNVSFDEVAQQTTQNAQKLFQLG